MTDDSGDGSDLYDKLPEFAAVRHKQLLQSLQPVFDLTEAYGELISRAVVALGSSKPASRQASIVRDLIADVFDFLYEWRRPLFEGRLQVGFPLGRRAYESLSLLSVCYQDEVIAIRWDRGEQIRNKEIREALARLPAGESLEPLQELYKTFSKGSHPNRELVSERFLGDGNEYVLGSIGVPELVLVVDQCISMVDLWFWFGALAGHVAKDDLAKTDPHFGRDYLEAAAHAGVVEKVVSRESFNNLLGPRQAEMRDELERRTGFRRE